MNKVKNGIIIAICSLLLLIAFVFEEINIYIKISLLLLYIGLILFIFIKNKKYQVFGNKIVNFLYSITILYFPISIWYFVFFDIQNTYYNVIDALFCVGFIGFVIADKMYN